jgi:hypothetical protein
MSNRPALLIAGRDSTGSPELVAAVKAAQAALAVALAGEYAQECALHDAQQAARTAPPEQLRQADAWCAKAGDKLHSAILEVKRATEQLGIAQTSLSQATGSARRSAGAHQVPVRSDVHRPTTARRRNPAHVGDTAPRSPQGQHDWSSPDRHHAGPTHPALHSAPRSVEADLDGHLVTAHTDAEGLAQPGVLVDHEHPHVPGPARTTRG